MFDYLLPFHIGISVQKQMHAHLNNICIWWAALFLVCVVMLQSCLLNPWNHLMLSLSPSSLGRWGRIMFLPQKTHADDAEKLRAHKHCLIYLLVFFHNIPIAGWIGVDDYYLSWLRFRIPIDFRSFNHAYVFFLHVGQFRFLNLSALGENRNTENRKGSYALS